MTRALIFDIASHKISTHKKRLRSRGVDYNTYSRVALDAQGS